MTSSQDLIPTHCKYFIMYLNGRHNNMHFSPTCSWKQVPNILVSVLVVVYHHKLEEREKRKIHTWTFQWQNNKASIREVTLPTWHQMKQAHQTFLLFVAWWNASTSCEAMLSKWRNKRDRDSEKPHRQISGKAVTLNKIRPRIEGMP